MANEEKVTAIDQLRMHIHDDTTFEAPDLEDLLAEIERLSAIEQERDALREALTEVVAGVETIGPSVTHDVHGDRKRLNWAVGNIARIARAALNQTRTDAAEAAEG